MSRVRIALGYVGKVAVALTQVRYSNLKAYLFERYVDAVASQHIDEVDIGALVDMADPVHAVHWDRGDGNLTHYELLCLNAVVKPYVRDGFVEIGTYDGRTAANVAVNNPKSVVYTLDLPPGVSPTHDVGMDIVVVRAREELAMKCVESPNVVMLHGDSATFDFSGISFQACLVDGAHSDFYVRNDTEKMLQHIDRSEPPGALIVWHDYGTVPAVVRYLNELARACPIRRIRGTTLCLLHLPATP